MNSQLQIEDPTTTILFTQIQTRLLSHQSAFNTLLSLIPAKLYLPTEENFSLTNKFSKNKKPKAEIKDLSKKAKKEKLDPNSKNSIPQIQQSLLEAKLNPTSDSDNETSKVNSLISLKPGDAHLTVSDLRLKLQAKINSLRKGRRAMPIYSASPSNLADSGGEGGMGDGGKEDLGLPRSRQEILERRQKRKEVRRQKKIVKKANGANVSGGGGNKDKKQQNNEVEKAVVEVVGDSKKRKIDDVVEDISFGAIDFGTGKQLELLDGGLSQVSKKRKGPTDTAGRLQQVKSNQEKLDKLKLSNPEKHKEVAEKQVWSNLLAKAKGEKIKDDPKLLEKTLKRETKIKEKKNKEWVDRKETMQSRIDHKQKKREENLKKRIDGKKKKFTKK